MQIPPWHKYLWASAQNTALSTWSSCCYHIHSAHSSKPSSCPPNHTKLIQHLNSSKCCKWNRAYLIQAFRPERYVMAAPQLHHEQISQLPLRYSCCVWQGAIFRWNVCLTSEAPDSVAHGSRVHFISLLGVWGALASSSFSFKSSVFL